MGYSLNAGFSEAKPWLKVADNYKDINVENELANGRIFKYYQQLIKLRKDYSVISEGTYRGIQLEHKDVYAYVREYDNQKLIVLNNFYGRETEFTIEEDIDFNNSEILISNYDDVELTKKIKLRPYECLAILFTAK